MHGLFIQYIVLVLIILGLVMIANKLRVAYPIVLVLGGLALSFTSEFSNITIHPERSSSSFFRRCFTKPRGRFRGKNFGAGDG